MAPTRKRPLRPSKPRSPSPSTDGTTDEDDSNTVKSNSTDDTPVTPQSISKLRSQLIRTAKRKLSSLKEDSVTSDGDEFNCRAPSIDPVSHTHTAKRQKLASSTGTRSSDTAEINPERSDSAENRTLVPDKIESAFVGKNKNGKKLNSTPKKSRKVVKIPFRDPKFTYRVGIDDTLPPMFSIPDIIVDMSHRSVVLGIRCFVQHLGGRQLRIGTMCSGTEAPVVFFREYQKGEEDHNNHNYFTDKSKVSKRTDLSLISLSYLPVRLFLGSRHLLRTTLILLLYFEMLPSSLSQVSLKRELSYIVS
jgi:hypothetical protein